MLAGKLELACKEKQDDSVIDALLADVLAELEPVIAVLQQITTGEVAAAPSTLPSISNAEIESELEKLQAFLEEGDTEANDLLDGLLEKLTGSDMARRLKTIAGPLNEYDFDAALKKLAEARAG
jgi:hypothetical protein